MGALKVILLRELGLRPYVPVWQAMQTHTAARTADTPDELWLVEHPPVYTLGLNARDGHVLDAGDIPVVQVDRGGQVTYHGPGQIVLYPLLDLRRLGMGIRPLVTLLEQTAIELLADYGVAAEARPDAPGVYVAGRKIASLGLRVRRGGCYHGLSLNVAMDLAPFRRIDPCGYPGLEVTQLADLGVHVTPAQAGQALAERLVRRLGYTIEHAGSELGA